MKKETILIFSSLTVAALLGIYGQDLAYFLDGMKEIKLPVYYLTGITLVSILLFITTLFLIYTFVIHEKIKKTRLVPYIFLTLLIGIPTSLFSLFAVAMWWE